MTEKELVDELRGAVVCIDGRNFLRALVPDLYTICRASADAIERLTRRAEAAEAKQIIINTQCGSVGCGCAAVLQKVMERVRDEATASAVDALAAERAKVERLQEIVDGFWRHSLVIESSVRNAEGRDSPVHCEIVKAILAAQEFYKTRPALSPSPSSVEPSPDPTRAKNAQVAPSPAEGEGEKLNPDIQERDKHRPIQVHCLGLLIQKATGCGDNAAITAAYQAWDFCGHPVCCGSAIDQDELARAFVVKYDQAAPLRESPAQQAGTGELADVLTKRRITHDEAREAVQRLVNSHFHQEPKGRFGIPARPDYDDDLVLHAYIEQQLASPAARDAALEEAIRRTRTRLEHYCNEANAGRMPSDAREFMRRIQCGFDSLFDEAVSEGKHKAATKERR